MFSLLFVSLRILLAFLLFSFFSLAMFPLLVFAVVMFILSLMLLFIFKSPFFVASSFFLVLSYVFFFFSRFFIISHLDFLLPIFFLVLFKKSFGFRKKSKIIDSFLNFILFEKPFFLDFYHTVFSCMIFKNILPFVCVVFLVVTLLIEIFAKKILCLTVLLRRFFQERSLPFSFSILFH